MIIENDKQTCSQIEGIAFAHEASTYFRPFKDLRRLESFKIQSEWMEPTDGQTSPLQILLDWKPMYLKAIILCGAMKQPSERSVLPPLLQTNMASMCPLRREAVHEL